MDASAQLAAWLNNDKPAIGKVVDFDALSDRLFYFDFTSGNKSLHSDIFADTLKFSEWVEAELTAHHCKFGIGGYMEHRTIYSRSTLFDSGEEPRRLHLGMDIWGAAGSSVYTPMNGVVHSFADNNHFGDYGPTIIIEHEVNASKLFSLYGHLSKKSLEGLFVGMPVHANQQIGAFGAGDENGNWPPHLHFQLMLDMQGRSGDYPGVCRYSEKAVFTQHIPDPQLLLRFPKAVNIS